MKKHIFFFCAAAAVLGLFSCSKTAKAPEAVEAVPDGAITVRIGIDEASTKVAYNTTDFKDFQINQVQIFVFDAQGKLETDYFSSVLPSNSTSVTLATFTGDKTVYAVANHPREFMAKDYLLADFEEKMLSDLSENGATNLVMSGKNVISVSAYNPTGATGSEPQVLPIYLKHLASLVVLDKITVNFNRTSLTNASFEVKEIYLKNVVGKCRLGMDGNTSTAQGPSLPYTLTDAQYSNADNWYNKITKQTSPTPPAVTYDACNISCSNVSGGTGNVMNRCLVAYPNPTEDGTDSHADSFNPRHTRLVIKAHVTKTGVITPAEGIDTYYVFDLPKMAPNNIYQIANITITMLGKDNDDKDDDLQQGRIKPTITVDPWTSTTQLNYEF